MTTTDTSLRTLIPAGLRPDVASGMERDLGASARSGQETLTMAPILAVGTAADPTMAYFVEGALKLGHIVPLWHPLHPCCVEWVARAAELRDPPAIFLRGFGGRTEEQNRMVSVLLDALARYPGTVINRPCRLLTNFSKPLHLKQIARESSTRIRVPRTHLARAGKTNPPGGHITKSISSVRSTCVASDHPDLQTSRLWSGPVLWQEQLSGPQWRVHVVGDVVLPLRVLSRELDYRQDSNVEFVADKLPDDVDDFCRRVTQAEGLSFSGIDFMQDEASGTFHVFEVNPQPGYSFFERGEKEGALPITGALIQLLTDELTPRWPARRQ